MLALLTQPSDKALHAEMRALGRSKDAIRAVDRLTKSLNSQDDAVREAAVAALRQQLETSDFPRLLETTKTPVRTRQNVLKALRYLKEPEYLPRVVAALSDPEAVIRAEAAWVLSVYGADQAEPQLIAALSDVDRDVRYYAADALGTLKTEPATSAVLERQKLEVDETVLFALRQAEKRQRRR